MLQKIPCPVQNLCTQELDVRPCPHVYRKDFKVVHDCGVVPFNDTPDLTVGVQVFRVGNVCEDGPGQDQFFGLDFTQDVVRVDSDNLCRVAKDGS